MDAINHFFANPTNWVVISFILFVFMFMKFAYGKVVAILDDRIADIEQELNSVETLRIEAQELLAQYQRKHRDAMKEADEILAKAKNQAENIRKTAEADLEATKQRREKQLEERLERIERDAVNDVKAYATQISLQAAETLIRTKMDKKSSKALLDESLEKIPAELG
jgi:F-type H+-transporting ATPase subunit b